MTRDTFMLGRGVEIEIAYEREGSGKCVVVRDGLASVLSFELTDLSGKLTVRLINEATVTWAEDNGEGDEMQCSMAVAPKIVTPREAREQSGAIRPAESIARMPVSLSKFSVSDPSHSPTTLENPEMQVSTFEMVARTATQSPKTEATAQWSSPVLSSFQPSIQPSPSDSTGTTAADGGRSEGESSKVPTNEDEDEDEIDFSFHPALTCITPIAISTASIYRRSKMAAALGATQQGGHCCVSTETAVVTREQSGFGDAQFRAAIFSPALESEDAKRSPKTSTLLELCAQPRVTLAALRSALNIDPTAVKAKDSKGRLPLHVLGDNEGLLQNPKGRKIATEFCHHLMKIYPRAIITFDNENRLPFVNLIEDWVEWVYDCHEKNVQLSSPGTKATKSRLRGLFSSRNLSSQTGTKEMAVGISAPSSRLLPRVILWEEAEWCFGMLSLGVDELDRKLSSYKINRQRHSERKCPLGMIAKHLVDKIPGLLRTILLVEDDFRGSRQRILRMPVLRRCFLVPDSVGPWITEMLCKRGIPCRRGVDYLQLVSTTVPRDIVGPFETVSSEDAEHFQEERLAVFDRVAMLKGIIPSLVVLDRKETERAASTLVIWHAMNRRLTRPFVVSLALIDFALHIVLLLAFRDDADPYRKNGPMGIGLLICSHYILRKMSEAVSMWHLSPRVFRSHISDVWTIIDGITIITAMVAFAWLRFYPQNYLQALNIIVLGLLWLKVLTFLKVVNKEMATFISALFQILQDLKYFFVILVVVLVMFADMLHISLSTKDDGLYCIENEADLSSPAQDFCSAYDLNSILRVYALLLGDIELDEWKETTGMVVLFVAFTVIGVIILLNVLIAVICDSYAEARVKGSLLFGRARVTFVAQNGALEFFLWPPSTEQLREVGRDTNSSRVQSISGRFFRCFILVSLIGTAIAVVVYLIVESIRSWKEGGQGLRSFAMCVMSVILSMSLFVMITYAVRAWLRSVAPKCVVVAVDYLDSNLKRLLALCASKGMGMENGADLPASEDESWERSEQTAEKRAHTAAVTRAKNEIVAEMQALEKRINELLEANQDSA